MDLKINCFILGIVSFFENKLYLGNAEYWPLVLLPFQSHVTDMLQSRKCEPAGKHWLPQDDTLPQYSD
jgi:hypothetical protein